LDHALAEASRSSIRQASLQFTANWNTVQLPEPFGHSGSMLFDGGRILLISNILDKQPAHIAVLLDKSVKTACRQAQIRKAVLVNETFHGSGFEPTALCEYRCATTADSMQLEDLRFFPGPESFNTARNQTNGLRYLPGLDGRVIGNIRMLFAA